MSKQKKRIVNMIFAVMFVIVYLFVACVVCVVCLFVITRKIIHDTITNIGPNNFIHRSITTGNKSNIKFSKYNGTVRIDQCRGRGVVKIEEEEEEDFVCIFFKKNF